MTEETEQETVRIEGLEIPVGDPQAAVAEAAEDVGLVPPKLPENTPEQPDEVLQTECAFIVFLDPNGSGKWIANGEILGKPIAVGRSANLADFTHACADITKDLIVQDTVNAYMMTTAQIARQAREAMVSQQVAAQLAKDGHGASTAGALDLSRLGKG